VLRRRKIYYAMVENFDQNVGRILSWLRHSGLDRNTIVAVTSDHGELGGSHAMEEKQYPYEESVGVPLIVWGPRAGIPQARVIDEPTCTEDLYPTFLGLCGAQPREPLPGIDLSPLIRGERDSLDRPGVMLEFVLELRAGLPFHENVYRGFRSKQSKYTVLGDTTGGMKPWQFFDLQSDPYEMHNLLDDAGSREAIEQHHAWLRARMVETLDHAVLASAWGQAGLNLRQVEPLFAGYDKRDQRVV
jgi:arylsulfatase A-like enzyme